MYSFQMKDWLYLWAGIKYSIYHFSIHLIRLSYIWFVQQILPHHVSRPHGLGNFAFLLHWLWLIIFISAAGSWWFAIKYSITLLLVTNTEKKKTYDNKETRSKYVLGKGRGIFIHPLDYYFVLIKNELPLLNGQHYLPNRASCQYFLLMNQVTLWWQEKPKRLSSMNYGIKRGGIGA